MFYIWWIHHIPIFSLNLPSLFVCLAWPSLCSESSNSICFTLFIPHIKNPPHPCILKFCRFFPPFPSSNVVSPVSLPGFPAAVIFNWCFCAPAFILCLFFPFSTPPHPPKFSSSLLPPLLHRWHQTGCLLPAHIKIPCLFLCEWEFLSPFLLLGVLF